MRVALIAFAALAASGCVTQSPTSCDVGYTHVSHPLQGAPFGPENEEGTIDMVGPNCRWESGRLTMDTSLNYMIPDSDLYGDDFVFVGRVAYKIWGNN